MGRSIEQYSAAIAVACLIGTGLSVYSYYVASKLEEDESYEALCDINEKISCTQIYQSEYGRGFGLVESVLGENSMLNQPNGLYGLLFYTLITVLGLSKRLALAKVQVTLVAISNLFSMYMAYLLVFVLGYACIVCISIYAINIITLILVINRFKALIGLNDQPAKKPTSKKKLSGDNKKQPTEVAADDDDNKSGDAELRRSKRRSKKD